MTTVWVQVALVLEDIISRIDPPKKRTRCGTCKRVGHDKKICLLRDVAPPPVGTYAEFRALNAPSSINIQDTVFVYFDLETAGIDEIIEIAHSSAKESVFQTLARPSREVDPIAFHTEIHGITPEMLMADDIPSFPEAFHSWIAALAHLDKPQGSCCLVAHNGTSKDVTWLMSQCEKHGLGNLFDHWRGAGVTHFLDSLEVVKSLKTELGIAECGLDYLHATLCSGEAILHRALGDSQALQKVMERVLVGGDAVHHAATLDVLEKYKQVKLERQTWEKNMST